MEVEYHLVKGEIDISFNPEEVRDLAFLMELIWEEEWKRGTHVPDLRDRSFFKRLANTKKRARVKFSFEYLEFCIVFLEEACIEFAEKEMNTVEIEKFLDDVSYYCSAGDTIH